MNNINFITEDELKHYGVLGMRWGIRKGRASQAYSKGVKKLKKLDKESNRLERKSAHMDYQSSKKMARGNIEKGMKLQGKAKKLHYKSVKLQNKGKKFYKKMEKEFANVDMSTINQADIDYGKRYANIVLS